tara:strand:- start:136 stop:579 length:444 start_codon:yes stop_codon:yes gene_type:complete
MLLISTFFFIQPNLVTAAGGLQALQALKKVSKLNKTVKNLKKNQNLKSTNPATTNTRIDPSTYFYFYPFVAQPLRESSNLNEKLRKQKNDKCLEIIKTKSVSPIFKKPDIKSVQVGEFSIGEKICIRKQDSQWIATNYGWIQKKNAR